MHLQALSEFVGSIYDTVVDANACPTMLNGLADLLGATSGAQVGTRDGETNRTTILAPRVSREEWPGLSQYWADVWRQCAGHPIGTVLIPEMSNPQRDRPVSDIRNGSAPRRGAERIMAATLLTGGPVSTFVSVSRPYSGGAFGATQMRLFATLIPHLQRAVQLRRRLAALEGPPTGSAEMLDRLPHAVLLVDAGAGVIFANQAAAKVLGTGDGLSMGRAGLQAETAEATRWLRQTIAACAALSDEFGGAGGRLRLPRRERGPLTMLVIPHRTKVTWSDILRPTALLFITDPEHAVTADSGWLRQDFGLTPAEAVLAAEISKGDGLQAAAGRLGVSLATVRTHLAHVFDKTGTRRQAEFVRLIPQASRRQAPISEPHRSAWICNRTRRGSAEAKASLSNRRGSPLARSGA
jgi:DNA-binding CsgD family transcriptional regulator/PAS domain-containing protein